MKRLRSHGVAPGQLALGLAADSGTIHGLLCASLRADGYRGALVSEMGVGNGSGRIDVAAVTDRLEGYEIKAGRDDLRRLERQVTTYGKVFDRLTLVGSERHLSDATPLLPEWWGLLAVQADGRKLQPLRPAGTNPGPDPMWRARLLWKQELLAILGEERRRSARTTRSALYEELVDTIGHDELQQVICRQLSRRQGWSAVR